MSIQTIPYGEEFAECLAVFFGPYAKQTEKVVHDIYCAICSIPLSSEQWRIKTDGRFIYMLPPDGMYEANLKSKVVLSADAIGILITLTSFNRLILATRCVKHREKYKALLLHVSDREDRESILSALRTA